MTDSAEAGSVVADAQPAGTPAQPTGETANGSAATPETNPFSGLSEGTRKWVETKGYKTLDDALAGGMNAESRLGSAITLPAEDAPETEWNEKVFSRLPESMRPIESADKIEFKLPAEYPENLPYNDAFAGAIKPVMADAKLSAKQAQAVHDGAVKYLADQALAQQAAIAQSVETTHDDLVKEWGPADSDGFKQKLEVANRAMKNLGLVDAYKQKGILLDDGSLTEPQIAKAFQAIGDAMFREDTIGAGDVVTGENPFKRTASGERNLMAINALVKADPERAKRLAREAGENPDLWMPNNPY